MKKELLLTITYIEEHTYNQLTRERLCFFDTLTDYLLFLDGRRFKIISNDDGKSLYLKKEFNSCKKFGQSFEVGFHYGE